jgi:hypothetical protein
MGLIPSLEIPPSGFAECGLNVVAKYAAATAAPIASQNVGNSDREANDINLGVGIGIGLGVGIPSISLAYLGYKVMNWRNDNVSRHQAFMDGLMYIVTLGTEHRPRPAGAGGTVAPWG